jgi:hypothetical protein
MFERALDMLPNGGIRLTRVQHCIAFAIALRSNLYRDEFQVQYATDNGEQAAYSRHMMFSIHTMSPSDTSHRSPASTQRLQGRVRTKPRVSVISV